MRLNILVASKSWILNRIINQCVNVLNVIISVLAMAVLAVQKGFNQTRTVNAGDICCVNQMWYRPLEFCGERDE